MTKKYARRCLVYSLAIAFLGPVLALASALPPAYKDLRYLDNVTVVTKHKVYGFYTHRSFARAVVIDGVAIGVGTAIPEEDRGFGHARGWMWSSLVQNYMNMDRIPSDWPDDKELLPRWEIGYGWPLIWLTARGADGKRSPEALYFNRSSQSEIYRIHPGWETGSLVAEVRGLEGAFPLGIRPVPMLINIAGFGLVSAIVQSLLYGWLCASRRRRSLCPNCAYDIRGLQQRLCPECGSSW